MVTHSTKAASHARRVLFIKDGEVFHQIYRGNLTSEELYAKISDTLTMLTTGGEKQQTVLPAVSVDRDADGGILLYHAVPQSQSGTG